MNSTMTCIPQMMYTLLVQFLAYVTVVVLLGVVYCVIKCVGERSSRGAEEEEGETSHLVSTNKGVNIMYGTCQYDMETGNCSTSSGSSDNKCLQGIYDPKICVICYDGLRNCFFVPCGHSATCRICAERIFYEDNRTCPVCRRFICKIRKMSAS